MGSNHKFSTRIVTSSMTFVDQQGAAHIARKVTVHNLPTGGMEVRLVLADGSMVKFIEERKTTA